METSYKVDKDSHSIVHEYIPLFARHIKLLFDIRKKLLQEHECLGLIRNYSEVMLKTYQLRM